MRSQERLKTRGVRRGARLRTDLAGEVLDARLGAGLSQDEVGRRLGWSGDKVARIESGRSPSLTIADAAMLAAILGLDLSLRAYPTGAKVRDASQSRRIAELAQHVGSPLRCRTDAPLPQREGLPLEMRAWDILITGHGERTAVEFEARVHDFQAVIRRHSLKRRDDPVDHFLLVLADTRHNRQLVGPFADLAPDLPRRATVSVLRTLRSGRHAGSGLVLL